MASLEQNRLLPFIAGAIVLTAGAVVFYVSRDNNNVYVAEGGSTISVPELTEVDADNTADTIRALSGYVDKLTTTVDEVTLENETIKANKNEIITTTDNKVKNLERQLAKQLKEDEQTRAIERQASRQQMLEMKVAVDSLRKQLTAANNKKALAESNTTTKIALDTKSSHIDLGGVSAENGMLPGLGFDTLTSGDIVDGRKLLDVVWVNPIDVQSVSGDDSSGNGNSTGIEKFLNQRNIPKAPDYVEVKANQSVNNSLRDPLDNRIANSASDTEKMFTIPDLSILSDSVALTSLVGRVYSGDTIKDPWPFKVMVRGENLTANYMSLPEEINGMLYEGYAIGDWTLGCVRGWLTAATFVLHDGTTISAYANSPGSRDTKSRFSDSAIGYISDAYGNPCVAGTKVTDAPKYLAGRTGAAALTGYASALNSENELSRTSISGDGTVDTITQVLNANGEYAVNEAYAEAFTEGARWIKERQAQAFDAVYVRPGASVVVNLQSEIRLDRSAHTRFVSYEKQSEESYELLD